MKILVLDTFNETSFSAEVDKIDGDLYEEAFTKEKLVFRFHEGSFQSLSIDRTTGKEIWTEVEAE